MSLIHAYATQLADFFYEATRNYRSEVFMFFVAVFFHILVMRPHRTGREIPANKKLVDAPSKKHISAGTTAMVSGGWMKVVSKRLGTGASELAAEIQVQLPEITGHDLSEKLASLVDAFGARRALLEGILLVLHERTTQPSERLAEQLLHGFKVLLPTQEFQSKVSDMEALGEGDLSVFRIVGLKAAIVQADLHAALEQLAALPKPTKVQPLAKTWKQLAQSLKKGHVPMLLQSCRRVGFDNEVVQFILCEVLHGKEGRHVAKDVEEAVGLAGPPAVLGAIVRCYGSSQDALRLLEFCHRDSLTVVATAALDVAANLALDDGQFLVDRVLAYLPEVPCPTVLTSLLKFYRVSGEDPTSRHTSVLDMYERLPAGVSLPAEAERILLDSALQLDRRDIVECLVARSHGDFRMQALVKQLGQQKRLADAEVIFQACPSPSSAMFAVMIEACGASCELEAARRYGKLASSMGKADVAVRGAMAKVGTKMGQIQAFVEADSKRSLDKISCSLLLKSIQPGVKSCTVEQIMTAVAALEPSDIDEVLLCSAVDSCLRVARADLLFPWLADLQKAGVVECRRVHTFDSMIRAYGSCKNAEGVWRTWKDMRLARVGPSSITVGCMVEALVANGDSDAAYDLCIDLHSEVGGLMNSVILGTLLKGFAHQKRFDRVWAVYQDMLSHHSDLTIVTFNTLIDACARCQEMSRIPQIMLDMEGMHLKPNLITFGTIVKGYVQDGKLDKAHMFVQSIHRSSNFKPDEIMYNTLLDGCAQHRVWERGLAILDEMQAVGITPSNFTISVLLKLARRSNRIDEAHDLCDRLAERYGLTFNVYVYGNMVSAYVDAGYAQKALGVVERMLKAHIQPNQRVYTLLIQGLLNQGELHIAVAVFRAAAGLSQMHAALQEAGGKRTRCQGGLPMDVLSEVLRNLLDAGPQWHECAATLLCDAEAAKLQVQREIKLRIAAMSGTAIGNAACQERPRHHRRR